MLAVPLDRTRGGMSSAIKQESQISELVACDTGSMFILSHGDTEESGMTHHGY